MTKPSTKRSVSLTTVIVLVLTTALSTAVWAAHNFTDVPDDNTFHADIEWLSENRVTRGCNPPANDEFCPSDNVTREQMAAFMRRLSQTFGSSGDQVTDTSDPISVPDTTPVELLQVDVSPQDEVNVVFNAHAEFLVETGATGPFEVTIARDSCTGTVVGSGIWNATQIDSSTPNETISITGYDTTDAATTYVLCAANGDPDIQAGTVNRRGLTATWEPTG